MPRSGGWDVPENFTGGGSAASISVQGCTLIEAFFDIKAIGSAGGRPPAEALSALRPPAEPVALAEGRSAMRQFTTWRLPRCDAAK